MSSINLAMVIMVAVEHAPFCVLQTLIFDWLNTVSTVSTVSAVRQDTQVSMESPLLGSFFLPPVVI